MVEASSLLRSLSILHPKEKRDHEMNNRGAESTPWDGSLVSLPSLDNSLISLPPSSRDSSPPPPHRLNEHAEPIILIESLSSTASTIKSDQSTTGATSGVSDDQNASSPFITLPLAPMESRLPSPPSSAESTPPPSSSSADPFHAHVIHPLASYLLADFHSPPGSPVSSAFSFSRRDTGPPSSLDGSPRVTSSSQHGGGGRWRRRRSSTNGSSARSTSGSGHSGEMLMMPIMRFPGEHGHHDRDREERGSDFTQASDEGKLKILILGHGSEERRALARLLGGDRTTTSDGDTDLSLSMLSARLSERSRTSSSGQILTEYVEEVMDELHAARSPTAAFFHPGTSSIEATELANRIATPLEQLEALMNPAYPSSQKVANLSMNGLRGELDCCLMLFSSPALPSEVAFARIISQVIPLFPVLILPPSPTSRPQKTSALVDAVQRQLTSAGVRWTSAFETLAHATKQSTFYLLPSSLLRDMADSSGPSSLSSSQELCPPPSEGFSTRSSSPANRGDLDRLRELVSAPSSRERIRRNRAIAFLDWREVELAARGQSVWSHDKLPSSWGDLPISEGERRDQVGLDFSRRVAERRAALAIRRTRPTTATAYESGDLYQHEERPPTPPFPTADSSFVTEPATPRCSQRYLPSSASSTEDSPPYVDSHPSMSLSSSYFGSAAHSSAPPSTAGTESLLLIPSVDPFHLPSLMSLVGLNLRLHLLPPPAVARASLEEKASYSGARSWVGTAVIFSALFVAGYVCGAQRAGAVGWMHYW